MKTQKGFTLIELMVVIVIIGILSALAIPKMFGVSAKAKAAEAPSVIANWETLQSAYAQETGSTGPAGSIGFVNPTSKWFTYTPGLGAAATTTFIARVGGSLATGFGSCLTTDQWTSVYTATGDCAQHGTATTAACAVAALAPSVPASAGCAGYAPNY